MLALRCSVPGELDRLKLQFLGTAYHPLRRAARDNVLMAQGLARLDRDAGEDGRTAPAEHARLQMRDLERSGHMAEDLDSLREALGFLCELGFADQDAAQAGEARKETAESTPP